MNADDPSRLPVATGREMLTALRDLSRGHRWALTATTALLIAAAGLGLVFPLTVGWIVDTVSAHPSGGVPDAFWWQLGLLSVAVVLAGVFDFAGVVALSRVAETMIATLRETYVERALHLPQATVERVGTGDIVARSSSDIRELSNSVPRVLPQLASAAFTFVLAIGGMAIVDWRFALGLLAVIPVYLLALRWYLRTAPPVYAAERAAESTRSQHVLSTVSALPTVAAYRLEERRHGLTRGATWGLVRWAMRARIVQNRLFGRINLAEAIGLVVILALGFALAATGTVGIGQITAAALLFFRITAPIGDLLFVMDDLQSAAASFARVVGVTQAVPEPAQKVDASAETESSTIARLSDPGSVGRDALTQAIPGKGEVEAAVVELRAVRFGYRSAHPVLNGIDLSIDHDEHIALVGASGSGKTTLARLIAGTHAPDLGTIERRVGRHRIAYLSQEHHVFAGTLRDNLSLARPDADDPTLIAALEGVLADHLLRALPDGLDTVIGRHGHPVTPADGQHIALARMLLKDPLVAILDEATAEADSRDTSLLDRATTRVIRGRGAIVIAHRLTQAVDCDRIVVLDAGRIVEEGDHNTLLSRSNGTYAHLWRAWVHGREKSPRNDLTRRDQQSP